MKTKNSHIVFLTPGFAESEKDSTTIPALQVYLKNLKKKLPKTKMTIITFQFPFINKVYDWNEIEVISLNGNNKRYKKFWIWRKATQTLKKIHQINPISVLHSFWIGECSLIASKFSIKNNIKHITTVMGQDACIGNKYVVSLKKTNTKIVTLSKNHKNILLKNYNLNSIIIPWDLDKKSFPRLQKNTIDIIGVGSLNEIKNYTLFIDVIDNLVKDFPALNVEIIGGGIKKNELEKQIKDLHLTENISFTDLLPRTSVLKKMSEASLLLHTSSYESFGFVFLEALFSGMDIISFNVGIAKPSSKWKVCISKKEMINACRAHLKESTKEKKRIYLNKSSLCLSSYLKLYDA